MIVLAFNCGSSSLKFELSRISRGGTAGGERLARGSVQSIGQGSSVDLEVAHGKPERWSEPIADHARGVEFVIERLRHLDVVDALNELAVGHRVVHGGPRLVEPTRIDAAVLTELRALAELAPLHNLTAVAAIEAALAALPGVPSVAVFDTAFHRDLPARAAEYAIPFEITRRHAIRRAGFHGLAHRSMSERYAELGRRGGSSKLVTLQLGHGVSIAAIAGGRPVDVSMGFSPLEGLMMGTRSGDVDPALVAHLARCEHVSADEIVHWLNTRSGLVGVSGRSSDMRELLAAESAGDARAALAVEMFVYRIQKCVGAYLAALGGADALIFGGGIGERSAEIRARVCRGFEWCGLTLDADTNARAAGEARISREGAGLEAWVLPVDEERLISLDTFACLERG